MPLCSVEEAIADIKQGKMIILVDDEDRENEGDLTMAAEFATPEAINFMAKYGRGLICLPMAPEMVDKLGLPMMTQRNGSRFGTNFTVSIEARDGISTGISAADRATTIQTAVADKTRPEDIVSPGHVFPLRAKAAGVLARTGQTEGSVDLARLAGLKPAAVICEIMREDGTMARMPDLEEFAATHNLKIAAVKDIIRYRLERGQVSVKREATGAVVGLLHDVFITVGLLSLLDVEIDLNVMAAVLTIIGYSLNDTIIVYDRLRENLRAAPNVELGNLINRSVNQTLSRTIITSGTTFIATLSLFLLGGGVIHDFALTMLIGVIVGTFSSIYVSSAILLAMGDTDFYAKTQEKEKYERPGEHGIV